MPHFKLLIRTLPLIACFIASPLAELSASESPILADRVLRFVNNSVVTQGEVWEEMGMVRPQSSG